MVAQKTSRSAGPSRFLSLAGSVVEVILVASGLLYVISAQIWTFFLWEGLAIVYIAVGWALAWSGERQVVNADSSARFLRWSWIPLIVSSVTGISSALIALAAKASIDRDDESAVVAAAASLGIVLSWMLLHAGFAKVYQAIDSLARKGRGVSFPGNPEPSLLNYIYFAFVIGTSFATSDPSIKSTEIRRIVVVHSVVSFFYNALIVAVAFQVLQQVITPSGSPLG